MQYMIAIQSSANHFVLLKQEGNAFLSINTANKFRMNSQNAHLEINMPANFMAIIVSGTMVVNNLLIIVHQIL